MNASLLAATFALALHPNPFQQDDQKPNRTPKTIQISKLADASGKAMLQTYYTVEPMDAPKLSPKKFPPLDEPYAFDYFVAGFVALDKARDDFNIRLKVFSQQRKEQGDLAEPATRLLLRIWEYNFKRLRLDHRQDMGAGAVDVYLCWGGKAGGEQLFDVDRQYDPKGTSVNTVYIYDLPSFTNKVEQVRELAHEYAHAVFPAIGGFEQPENWANGYMGEKLYLKWLSADLASGKLTNRDVMGVDPKALAAWVAKEVDPLMIKAAQTKPSAELLSGKAKINMDAYIGLSLWAEAVMPQRAFARAQVIVGSTEAKDLIPALSNALEGEEPFTVTLPVQVAGLKVWLPFGKCQINGLIIDKKAGEWVQVTVPKTPKPFRVIPPKGD